MRQKLTLLLLFIIACSMTMKTQTIPNGDFENWSQDTLYEEPQQYFTTNFQSAIMGTAPGAQKTTDSYSGNYAVKLTTKAQNGDTIPALLGLGNLNNLMQGIPYTDKPDSVFMHVKENMVPGDTANAIFLFKYMSNTIGMTQFQFTDSATSYQAYSKKINWFVPTASPDSVALIITSGTFNSTNNSAGSNITVDNLSFGSGYTDPPNNDFENWYERINEKPDSWLTSNSLVDSSNLAVEKTNDSYSGNYAAKVSTKLTITDDTIGFLTNGRPTNSTFVSEGGYQVSQNPDVLSGYYKYTPDGSDSALVSVYSYAKDQSTNNLTRVDSNSVMLPQANNYTLFEVPMNYDSWPVVDTVSIIFVPGKSTHQTTPVGLGSELYVDDLSMSYKPTSVEESTNRPLTIAPNPAREKTRINLSGKEFQELKVISIDGQLIENINIKEKDQITLNTNEYPRGVVLLKFSGNNSAVTKKLILQ